MHRSGTGTRTSSSRNLTAVLFAILAGLVIFIAMAPGGPMGLFQGIAEKKDAGSIAVLASLIGISFVLLHRNGALPDKEEVETAKL